MGNFSSKYFGFISFTRKYPLRGYILGVLTHTTALDRLWGGDETLKCVIVIYLTCTNNSRSCKSKTLLFVFSLLHKNNIKVAFSMIFWGSSY